ncbi:MAG: FKBP-type peptidyl-prolyl cis-trans isomerase [Prevotella sp.]|nr:FKBP-type peptidyl-prolyl cis-trans isomerase [Prevotella sp.]
MKKILVNITLLLSSATTFAQSVPTDSLSYAAGIFVGESVKQMMQMNRTNFERMEMPFDEKLCLHTALAMIEGNEMALTGEQAMAMLNKAVEDSQKRIAANNKAKGEAFLAQNAKNKGVKTTASGLQYKVITKGKGIMPSEEDTVKVHYAGRTIDGEEFDSSIKRGEPAEFKLSQVIKGWTEVLQLMPVGSKWEVYIPSELAYGERNQGEHIKPNSVLIFTIELLDVKKVTPEIKKSAPVVKKSPKAKAK